MKLSTNAKRKSTYIITVDFSDDDSNAVAPTSATWTLMDRSGNVINDRSDVAISPLSSSNDIVLSGDDLDISGNGTTRKLRIDAIYDSDAGTDLPLRDQVEFTIDDITEASS